ncbi:MULTISPECIES: enoyl-CoA hydratase/isomerase family protein [Rhodococcus]|uniref:enoyl-CoA hydratase/isomerase family protein n=1 Tax=Rhodococcus TaxID=1827 RepID=UPI0021BA934B|nr:MULTISPECIES: enoyl-CoA hydratase/isomerase family protein [Rhodococcus]MBQ7804029.1 enoyl-CoA hydratase/isomerase family protein [Rhodococcus sp. (in: high G+C Gram-positive bacteria)]UXF67285.1 enoyl-CoA hydratase/isomerase family protein [Rhodococcus qingshengii]
MTAHPTVIVSQAGPVRTLTMNRPDRRNALDDLLVEALDMELTAAEEDPHTRSVILAGSGRSFCAGADLQYFLGLHAELGSPITFLRRVSALVTRFETSPLPIVAALHGHAVAGGLELALGADIVVAADTTLIGDGHIRNNLLPAAGSSVRLPRKVGDAMARWLALTGELVTPDKLAATGWIHAVVEQDQLSTAAHEAAAVLAEHSGPAQSRFKALLFDLTTMDPRQGLAEELDVFDAHWASNDVPSSLNAFLDRKAQTARTIPSNSGQQ